MLSTRVRCQFIPYNEYNRKSEESHSFISCSVVLQKVIPLTGASRVYTGPRVQGSHPVLVSFESHSDRLAANQKAFTVTYDQWEDCILFFADRKYWRTFLPEPTATPRLQIKEWLGLDIAQTNYYYFALVFMLHSLKSQRMIKFS